MTLAEDLVRLIGIPSVTGQEETLALYMRDRLATSGRPVVLDGRTVLVPPPSDRRPLVVLAGHLDTVPPRGNEQPRLNGETIWGRGASDMKGGLAVLLSLLDDPSIGAGSIRIGAILYAGEEGPLEENDLRRVLDGSGSWAASADLAILLEPTDNAIEVGCVGVVNLELVFKGEACHSARPWLGRNAIHDALPWLTRISSFTPREHSVGGFLFRETATVTTLRAGTARNMVPGELVANLNYRFPPGWGIEKGRASALALTEDPAEVRVIDIAPSGDVPIDRPLFADFVRRSGLECRAKQAWTDVAQFSERGVPAINFGPGDPHLAHRDDERVTIGALHRSAETLGEFLRREGPFRPTGEA